jgi:hypothetical protein
MTHIVVSIIVLSERICKEKKNTARENLAGFLWIVTIALSGIAARCQLSQRESPWQAGQLCADR